jgi:tetratricopeptide (TPR) repeat protein
MGRLRPVRPWAVNNGILSMRLNSRYLLRLVALAIALAVVVHFIHWRQLGKQAYAFQHQAETAEQQGDHARAEAYLRRLLAMRPHDVESRARLVAVMQRSARSEGDWLQVVREMEQLLREAPDRDDVRRREVALILGTPRLHRHMAAEVKGHIKELLARHPDDGAIHEQNGEDLLIDKDYDGAANAFAKAVALKPELIPAYARVADVLRHRLSRAREADERIATMLAKNGESAAAHLAAAFYWKKADDRKQFAREVALARKYGPEDPEVVLTVADVARERAEALAKDHDDAGSKTAIDEACALLRPAIDRGVADLAAPDRDEAARARSVLANLFLALAALEVQADRVAAAIEVARRGVAAIPERADLRLQLVEACILHKDWPEADKQLDELAAAGHPAGVVNYHRGRVLAGQAKWLGAVAVLRRASAELDAQPALGRRASLLLGACYERIGLPDRACESYQSALPRERIEDEDVWRETSLRKAAVLAAAGQTANAIRAYEDAAARSGEALLPLARLLLTEAARRPEGERDWAAVEDALRRAPEGVQRELIWADYHLARGKPDDSREVLTKAAIKYPKNVEFPGALAVLEFRRERNEEANKILADAEVKLGDRVEFRLIRASMVPGGAPTDAGKELERLATGLDQFMSAERARLLRGLAEAAQVVAGRDVAERLWDRLAAEAPNDLGVQLIRFDRAVEANDEARLEQAKAAILRMDGAGGSITKLAHVLHSLWRARVKSDNSGLDQASQLLGELEREGSGLGRVFLAQALVLELQQKPLLALGKYRQAIDAGARDPQAIRRLVELYYEQKQYAEAESVLRRLPKEAGGADRFLQVAAEVSLAAREFARALELAAKAVPTDTKDYRKQLWLSRVLALAGKPKEAEAPLLRARDLAPDEPDVWVALVQYRVNRNQRPAAKKTIEEARQRLDKSDAALALARCYEVVGRFDLAGRLYDQALKEHPDDVRVLRNAASLRLREGNLADSRKLLERVMANSSSTGEDLRLARRLLVIAIAADPQPDAAKQALDLVSRRDSPGASPGAETVEEMRTHALALALQRDMPSKRQAIKLLEDSGLRQPLQDDELFLLAHMYNAVGDWPRARSLLTAILRSEGDSSERATYVAYYGLGLIRQPDLEEAERWVGELERLQPGMLRTVELRARLLAAVGNVAKASDLLLARAERSDVPLAPIARLLEELGATGAAESLYRKLVSASGRPEATLLLASFAGRQNRVGEALELCDRARTTADPESLCGTYVDILYSAREPRAEQIRLAVTRVEEALAKKPESAVLLGMMAALLNLKEDYGGAVTFYRRALARRQNDVLSRNNLAFLLSASQGKYADALKEIAQAKTMFGPLPTLLDTEALIYLASGDPVRAAAILNEVIVETPSASYYYHLAQAHEAAGRHVDALVAWRQAQKRGLKPTDLHPLERAAYRKAEAEFTTN